MNRYFAPLVLGLAVLGGCSETASQLPATPTMSASGMRTGSQADEGACERAVTRQTNNPDVVTLSSDFSQAGTRVIVGVGPQRARWSCIVSRGVASQVMSLTDEGAL